MRGNRARSRGPPRGGRPLGPPVRAARKSTSGRAAASPHRAPRTPSRVHRRGPPRGSAPRRAPRATPSSGSQASTCAVERGPARAAGVRRRPPRRPRRGRDPFEHAGQGCAELVGEPGGRQRGPDALDASPSSRRRVRPRGRPPDRPPRVRVDARVRRADGPVVGGTSPPGSSSDVAGTDPRCRTPIARDHASPGVAPARSCAQTPSRTADRSGADRADRARAGRSTGRPRALTPTGRPPPRRREDREGHEQPTRALTGPARAAGERPAGRDGPRAPAMPDRAR